MKVGLKIKTSNVDVKMRLSVSTNNEVIIGAKMKIIKVGLKITSNNEDIKVGLKITNCNEDLTELTVNNLSYR